ncbi:CU044_5270 family protein [Streptomyces sp. NPDC101160]|uniref:CU044_5270 family protein n=1 Tax=Streptomyces sp. NPDC101160 TaxID=3366118 RepID=UPI00380C9252
MRTPADDSRLRADLVELLPPPEVLELTPLRHQALKHRILNAAQKPTQSRVRSQSRSRSRRVPRFAVPAAAGAALAAALVLAVVSGEPHGPADPRRQDGGVAAAPVTPTADQVLSRAALAASVSPQAAARPDQFVYIESLTAHAARRADGGPAALPQAHRRQVWLSADGTREGLLREAGAPDTPLGVRGRVYELDHRGATPRPGTLGPAEPSITQPTHTFVASLPTDPETLLRLVYAQTRPADGGDPHQRAFTAIGTLLTETWAPPRVTAALYEAAARIPGTSVLPRATDAAGREGVAVARTAHGEQTQWIFDRTTSAFLGERTVLTRAGSAGPAGTLLGTTAVLTKAVADRPGEVPPAS